MYQVGRPSELKGDDPWFETAEAAIEHARRMHKGEDADNPFGFDPVGVWDDRSDWAYLWFDGHLFKRQ